jgi:peptidoglycan hydrolase-like protein with peptidoglycan-binding domain
MSDVDQERSSGDVSDRPRSRRTLLVVVAIAMATGIAYVAAGRQTKSPAVVAAETAPPPSTVLTIPVERREIAATLRTRGSVVAQNETAVTCTPRSLNSGQSAGADATAGPIFTIRPMIGATVKEGDRLAEVVGRPVLLLTGDVPAYRDMGPGMSGKDIEQLRGGLERLGFTTTDPPGTYGPSTQEAVAAWYRSLGYQPAEPSPDEADQLRQAKNMNDQAALRVMKAERALSRARAQRSQPGTAEQAESALDLEALEDELAEARQQQLYAAQEYARLGGRIGVRVPLCEVVFVPSLPALVGGAKSTGRTQPETDRVPSAASGSSTGSGEWAVLSSGDLVIAVNVPSPQAGLIRLGASVQADDDTKAGSALTGVVASIADRPGTDGATASQTHVVVKPVSPLDAAQLGAELRVQITIDTSGGAVLAVPVSALTPKDGGVAEVQKRVNGANQPVAVRPGLSADGWVQIDPIEPSSLNEGDEVVIGTA